jgi:hypothetical protein
VLLLFIYLRNCCAALRRAHSALFAYVGRLTLECYLLQHHCLLTECAKALLVLVPGYPKVSPAGDG